MTDKERLIEILADQRKFDENVQKKLGRDRAIIYSVYLLEKHNFSPTFQRICVVSSKLFPESFSLTEFSEFPDSRVVRNCLWHCVHKSKGWLQGSDKTKYNITEKGKDIISIFLKLLDNNMDVSTISLGNNRNNAKKELVTRPVDSEMDFLSDIKKSNAYLAFMNNQELKSIDIKKSLRGDRYSSPAYLNNNLDKAQRIAEMYDDKDILRYLVWVRDNWENP